MVGFFCEYQKYSLSLQNRSMKKCFNTTGKMIANQYYNVLIGRQVNEAAIMVEDNL